MSKISKEQELLNEIEKLQKQLEIANNRVKKAEYGLVWMEVPEAFDQGKRKPITSFRRSKRQGYKKQR